MARILFTAPVLCNSSVRGFRLLVQLLTQFLTGLSTELLVALQTLKQRACIPTVTAYGLHISVELINQCSHG